MNNIYNFSNIIKYDLNKCTKCNQCVNICKFKALSFCDGILSFKKENCIACRKCIQNCPTHALYYNINANQYKGKNCVAVIPSLADKKFLLNQYENVVTTLLGEKIKVIETAFEMEKLTSNYINDETKFTLILSDIENIDLILSKYESNIVNHLSKVKNHFYITSYVYRLLKLNKDLKISCFGIPFEEKMSFEKIKMIDEISDIPYKNECYYSLLDVLNIYMKLCKLECSENLSELKLEKSKSLNLTNKYLNIKILITKDINYLSICNYLEYDFIFVLKHDKYVLREDVLKDEEVNLLYKKKLKAPLNTSAFFRKD